MRQRKPGEKQLRHAISFSEMGITRQNKCLNSQFPILRIRTRLSLDLRPGRCLRHSARDQLHPQVRTHDPGLSVARYEARSFRRWPVESKWLNISCATAIVSSVTYLISSSAARHASFVDSRTTTCKRIPNHRCGGGRRFANLGNLFRNLNRGLAPGEIDVSVPRGYSSRGCR